MLLGLGPTTVILYDKVVAWQNGHACDLGMFPHATTGYDDVEATNVSTGWQIIGFALCNGTIKLIVTDMAIVGHDVGIMAFDGAHDPF